MSARKKTMHDLLASTMVGETAETIAVDDLYSKENWAFTNDRSQTWAAAFRQFAPFQAAGRTIEDMVSPFPDETGYDAWKDPRLKNYRDNGQMFRFSDSGSYEETTRRMERFEADLEDLSILQMSDSGTAEFFAHMSSPTIFAPLAPVRAFRGATFGKRFTSGAGFTAAIMAPEEIMKASQSEGYTAGHSLIAMTGASILSGTLTGALGRAQNPFGRIADDIVGDDPLYRSAGASVSPEQARRTAYAAMEGDALAETGIGVEKLPWNPVNRLLLSPNPYVRSTAAGLVDLGGMIQKKIRERTDSKGNVFTSEAQDQSVESLYRAKFLGPLLDAIAESDKAYLAYRGVAAKESDIGRSIQMLKMGAGDFFSGQTQFFKQIEFRMRIGKALRRGDRDTIQDEMTRFVEQAAVKYRAAYNFIKDEAEAVKLFEKEIQGKINVARDAGDNAAVSVLEAQLKRIREAGVTVNTAESYLNRVWRVDKIMDNEQRFLSVVSDWAMGKYSMTRRQANKFSKSMMDEVTRSRPYFDLEEGTSQIDWVSNPSGVKARSFEIPDELVEEFLENDVEALLRHHTRTMGVDIELTRKFGDIDMRGVIDDVTTEYQRLIDDASDLNIRKALKKSLENDLRDIRGLRDRVRGTYGASKDPHAMSSRFVRGMKSFNVLVGMGSAVVSSVPDVARSVMVEGLDATYKFGLQNLFRANIDHLKRMQKRELRASGVAADATLGLRASAFTDVGDLFGSRFGFERGLNQTTNAYFMLNGLNYWNQALKEFAGNVTMLRMTDGLSTNWSALSKADKEKFLKNGINQQDHYNMQKQMFEHGRKVDDFWMPETAKWTNSDLRLKFRAALNQNVERIIVTPGAGDRALWTSTELGSLMTQFKSYGQGAVVRVLTAGLQEKDAAFWQGALLMVGLASMVNEFKRLQYGIDNEEGYDEKLLNAVDRSGVLGWFMDVNNPIEKLTDYKLGLGPLLTDQQSYRLPDQAKLGSVFGPAISNVMTAGSVAGDVLSGNMDQGTADSARFILPTGNLPYLDPIYDGIFGQ